MLLTNNSTADLYALTMHYVKKE